MKYSYHYDSPIGRLFIAESSGFVTDVAFRPIIGTSEMETALLIRVASMLREYFEGKRESFDGLPLKPIGTDFQRKAWDALLTIPYGQTRSYRQQAEAAGNVKACRAVGAANGKNPISIVIPCHRVIGSNNKLVGYGGGLSIKQFLLEHEKRSLKSQSPSSVVSSCSY